MKTSIFLTLIVLVASGQRERLFAGQAEAIRHESGIFFGEGMSVPSSVAAEDRRIGPSALLFAFQKKKAGPRGPIVVKEPINHKVCSPNRREQLAGAVAGIIVPTLAVLGMELAWAFSGVSSPMTFLAPRAIGMALAGVLALAWGRSRKTSLSENAMFSTMAAATGFISPSAGIFVLGMVFTSQVLASWFHRRLHLL